MWLFLPHQYLDQLSPELDSVPALQGWNLGCASLSNISERSSKASVTWRGKQLQPQAWLRRWKQAGFIQRLSGLTLPHSTAQAGVDRLISSLAETRANQTVSPEKAMAQMTTDSLSTKLPGSIRSAGRVISSAKSSRGMRTGNLQPSSHHWKQWAAGLRQEYSARVELVLPTSEKDCSYWPTAKTISGGANSNRIARGAGGPDLQEMAQHWLTPNVPNGGRTAHHAKIEGKTATHKGKKVQLGLEHQTRNWPTARANDAEKRGEISADPRNGLPGQAQNWPTVTVADSDKANIQMREDHQNGLTAVVFSQSLPPDQATAGGRPSSPKTHGSPPPSEKPKMQLNPNFVEWLMGWPIGLSGFVREEMAFSQWLQQSHSYLSALCSLNQTKVDCNGQGSMFDG